jgi:hypothetical protein
MAEALWINEDEPIRGSFGTKGYTFYKGARGVLGTPPEASLRLIAVKGEEMVEISSVPELRGFVEISAPDEALEYVRLFTSIETHYLFPDVQYLEPRAARDDPGLGEFTAEYAQRMNLAPASSDPADDHFVVKRNLVDRAGELFRSTEQVGGDGAYLLVTRTTIDKDSPIVYPIYE